MRSIYKKIMIAAVCAAVAICMIVGSACGYRNSTRLEGDYSSGTVQSNGGFAVEKGNYIYFINGVASYTDDNSYGSVQKGALMRISVENYRNHNYNAYYDSSYAEVVVPQIIYTGDYTTGIYIYGDYVYYATPSTDRDSDGVVQNERLDFKSTRLDGQESMTGYYYQSESNTIPYRYTEIDGVVYLIYVDTEDYYDIGTTATNIHSVNTETGDNTVLAYDIDSYVFDDEDPESGVIYYTMSVVDRIGDEHQTVRNFNQLWRVTADATEPVEFTDYRDTEADDYNEDDPIYVNCGELVLDGIGTVDAQTPTQFEPYGEDAEKYADINHPSYTYSLNSFSDGTLYYTREATAEMMFSLEDDGALSSGDAVTRNPENTDAFFVDADEGSGYTFMKFEENGETVTKALYSENYRFVLGTVDDGQINKETLYCLTDDGEESSPSFLFTEGSYLYYSVTGVNDSAVYRLDYTGEDKDYNTLPDQPGYSDYRAVKILDLEFNSSWYVPELFEGQLMFASETDEMGPYGYIMVCDIAGDCDDGVMSNAEIDDLNEKYTGVTDAIDDIDSDSYENLANTLKYLSLSRDYDYIDELVQTYVEYQGKSENYLYSEESKLVCRDFYNATHVYTDDGAMKDWSEYASDYKTVNGETVTANFRDYYYTVIGEMTDDDYDDYLDSLRDSYMTAEAEDERNFWEKMSTAGKVWFVIGMSVCGLIVIAAIVIGIIFLVRYLRKRMRAAAEEAGEDYEPGAPDEGEEEGEINVYEGFAADASVGDAEEGDAAEADDTAEEGDAAEADDTAETGEAADTGDVAETDVADGAGDAGAEPEGPAADGPEEKE